MKKYAHVDVNGKAIEIQRPEPVIAPPEVFTFTKRTDPSEAIEMLLNDQFVRVKDFFSSGLFLLQEIKQYINTLEKNQTYQEQQDFRKLYRSLSHKVILQIRNHQLVVRKAPEIGWLKILYPDHHDFYLPFPQVQGLNSAWQWYSKGVKIPGLRDKIHPYYGTYFPTRFEHIELYETWLTSYTGEKNCAIDVGTGSGVLSLLLLKHGFNQVVGTDHNPNAIVGFLEMLKKMKSPGNMQLYYGDLFADCHSKADVIVFNPPWIPKVNHAEGLDTAVYYDEHLFPRFFEEAVDHLKQDGRLVLLFSNLAQITNVTEVHPIRQELETGNHFSLESFKQKQVKQASVKTRRNQAWRHEEQVELWILKRTRV